MSESALGSVFEISLRILLMLRELFPSKLDEQQVSALDFISVYASDFGLLDENLQAYGGFCFKKPCTGWICSLIPHPNRIQIRHHRAWNGCL